MEKIVAVEAGRLEEVHSVLQRIPGIRANALEKLNTIIVSTDDDSRNNFFIDEINKIPGVEAVADDGATAPMPYEVVEHPAQHTPSSEQ